MVKINRKEMTIALGKAKMFDFKHDEKLNITKMICVDTTAEHELAKTIADAFENGKEMEFEIGDYTIKTDMDGVQVIPTTEYKAGWSRLPLTYNEYYKIACYENDDVDIYFDAFECATDIINLTKED